MENEPFVVELYKLPLDEERLEILEQVAPAARSVDDIG
jgi:hypothetical protein